MQNIDILSPYDVVMNVLANTETGSNISIHLESSGDLTIVNPIFTLRLAWFTLKARVGHFQFHFENYPTEKPRPASLTLF